VLEVQTNKLKLDLNYGHQESTPYLWQTRVNKTSVWIWRKLRIPSHCTNISRTKKRRLKNQI